MVFICFFGLLIGGIMIVATGNIERPEYLNKLYNYTFLDKPPVVHHSKTIHYSNSLLTFYIYFTSFVK